MKNLASNDLNINKIIKSYFNLYFKDFKFLGTKKFILLKRRRKFMKNIHISDAEIKHTNSKAIITLYTINREKKILRKKFLNLNENFSLTLIRSYLFLYKNNISAIYNLLNQYKYIYQSRTILLKGLLKKNKYISYKLNYLNTFLKLKHLYAKKI
jgi:hypothetical protein